MKTLDKDTLSSSQNPQKPYNYHRTPWGMVLVSIQASILKGSLDLVSKARSTLIKVMSIDITVVTLLKTYSPTY